VLLPGFPLALPRLEQRSEDGIPQGCEIRWDKFRRVFVPMFGETALNPDGYPRHEDARHLVQHHREQAARVARKEA
jgi:hypothetical protein